VFLLIELSSSLGDDAQTDVYIDVLERLSAMTSFP